MKTFTTIPSFCYLQKGLVNEHRGFGVEDATEGGGDEVTRHHVILCVACKGGGVWWVVLKNGSDWNDSISCCRNGFCDGGLVFGGFNTSSGGVNGCESLLLVVGMAVVNGKDRSLVI